MNTILRAFLALLVSVSSFAADKVFPVGGTSGVGDNVSFSTLGSNALATDWMNYDPGASTSVLTIGGGRSGTQGLTAVRYQITGGLTNTTRSTVLWITSSGIEFGNSFDTLLSGSGGVGYIEGVAIAMVAGNIGAATATTPSAADNDTSVATTAFVQTELANRSTIWIDAGAMAPFATDGATAVTTTLTTNGVPVDEYSFDASTDKKVAFKLALPPGWNGTTLTAKFYWRTTATSGNCVWTIAGIFARDADNPDVTLGTAQSVTDGAQATANFQSITSATSTITPAGTYGSGATIYFVVTRDADNGSDTLASAALLDGVLLTWK